MLNPAKIRINRTVAQHALGLHEKIGQRMFDLQEGKKQQDRQNIVCHNKQIPQYIPD